MRRDKTTRRLPMRIGREARQTAKPRHTTAPVIEALERNLEDLKRLEASSAAMLAVLVTLEVRRASVI